MKKRGEGASCSREGGGTSNRPRYRREAAFIKDREGMWEEGASARATGFGS
jgi:hypothetical protein